MSNSHFLKMSLEWIFFHYCLFEFFLIFFSDYLDAYGDLEAYLLQFSMTPWLSVTNVFGILRI